MERCSQSVRLLGAVVCVVLIGFLSVPAASFGNHQGLYWQEVDEHTARSRGGFSEEARDAISALSDSAEVDLAIPVVFGVQVSDLTPNFGDARDDGARVHEGLDMLAPKGTPIASPTDAVVSSIGDGTRSGVHVYTINPGDEVFVYMHLDRIADGVDIGTALERGEVLGYVGNTGNASGGPAHLHFEIRKNGATDPFPRLTKEFTLEEKITSVDALLETDANPDALAAFIAEEYGDALIAATAKNIALPVVLIEALAGSGSAARSSFVSDGTASDGSPLPIDDLTIDAIGDDVVALQEFLIVANSGSATERLARAGATGYFGPITEAALAEYQKAVGISPALGYYGAITRAYIADAKMATPDLVEKTTPVSALEFTRDLTLDDTGDDVRALQEFLNLQAFYVSQNGPGAQGEETTYFGSLTEQALARFQSAHGISPAIGYFGPITRSFLSVGL